MEILKVFCVELKFGAHKAISHVRMVYRGDLVFQFVGYEALNCLIYRLGTVDSWAI